MDDLKRKALNQMFVNSTTDQVLEVTKKTRLRGRVAVVLMLTRTVGTSTSRVGSSKFGKQGMIVFFLWGGGDMYQSRFLIFITVEPPLR